MTDWDSQDPGRDGQTLCTSERGILGAVESQTLCTSERRIPTPQKRAKTVRQVGAGGASRNARSRPQNGSRAAIRATLRSFGSISTRLQNHFGILTDEHHRMGVRTDLQGGG